MTKLISFLFFLLAASSANAELSINLDTIDNLHARLAIRKAASTYKGSAVLIERGGVGRFSSSQSFGSATKCVKVKTVSDLAPAITMTCTSDPAGEDMKKAVQDITGLFLFFKALCSSSVSDYSKMTDAEKKSYQAKEEADAKAECPAKPAPFVAPDLSACNALNVANYVAAQSMSTAKGGAICASDADCNLLPCFSSCTDCFNSTTCDSMAATRSVANKTAAACIGCLHPDIIAFGCTPPKIVPVGGDGVERCTKVKTIAKEAPTITKTCTADPTGEDVQAAVTDYSVFYEGMRTECEDSVTAYGKMTDQQMKDYQTKFEENAKDDCPLKPEPFKAPSSKDCQALTITSLVNRLKNSVENGGVTCTQDSDCSLLECYATCKTCNDAATCDKGVASKSIAASDAKSCIKCGDTLACSSSVILAPAALLLVIVGLLAIF